MNQSVEKPLERVLLHRDDAKHNSLLQSLQATGTGLNALYQAAIETKLKPDFTLEELLFIEEPASYFKHLIYESKKEMLQALPFKKEVVLDMIELPDLTAFTQAFVPLQRLKHSDFPLHLFVIENGRVKPRPQQLLEYVDAKTSIYAQTEEELAAYHLCKKAFDLLTEIKSKYPKLNLLPVGSPYVFTTTHEGKLHFSKLSTKNVK